MRRVFLTLFFVILTSTIFAQVKFTYSNFNSAIARAKQSNLPIIVDVTEGSRFSPYFALAMKDNELVSLLNNSFVRARINVDLSRNKGFRDNNLYGLTTPVLAIYSPSGELVGKTDWYSLTSKRDTLSVILDLAKKSIVQKQINKRQIKFLDISLAEGVELANKENKPLFVFGYSGWSRSSWKMRCDVFTLNRVADYFNENFICLSVDIERDSDDVLRGNGAKLYPSFLFLDGNSDIIELSGGYLNNEEFLQLGERANTLFHQNKSLNFEISTLQGAKRLAVERDRIISVHNGKDLGYTIPMVSRLYNGTFIPFRGNGKHNELIFLNKNGVELHRYRAKKIEPQDAVIEAKRVIDGEGLAHYDNRYERGELDEEESLHFISLLERAAKRERIVLVIDKYLSTIDEEELLSEYNFNLQERYVLPFNSVAVTHFKANYQLYYESFGSRAEKYRFMVWYNKGRDLKWFSFEHKRFLRALSGSGLSLDEQQKIEKARVLENRLKRGKSRTFTYLMGKYAKQWGIGDFRGYLSPLIDTYRQSFGKPSQIRRLNRELER